MGMTMHALLSFLSAYLADIEANGPRNTHLQLWSAESIREPEASSDREQD